MNAWVTLVVWEMIASREGVESLAIVDHVWELGQRGVYQEAGVLAGSGQVERSLPGRHSRRHSLQTAVGAALVACKGCRTGRQVGSGIRTVSGTVGLVCCVCRPVLDGVLAVVPRTVWFDVVEWLAYCRQRLAEWSGLTGFAPQRPSTLSLLSSTRSFRFQIGPYDHGVWLSPSSVWMSP